MNLIKKILQSKSHENKDEKMKNEINEKKIKTRISRKVKSSFGIKRYKIQEVIKPGQVILIQVIKEERGQKGAALLLLYL